jgi:DNA mismatch endonuclease (patch repair protein)
MNPLVPPSAGRRRNMQAIRSRDTGPEVAIRRLLHARGLRYRVHHAPLASLRRRADIVFTRRRIAVFIDGCFWHACPEHGHAVRTNSDYWSPKLLRNVERDRETDAVLIAAGWTVLRFWEHLAPERVAQEIADVVAAASPPMSVRGRQ